MAKKKDTNISWPSGECIPVLGTALPLEQLAERFELTIFRAQDDLDWFVGAEVTQTAVGSLLIMRHDNNPYGLTAFYVDGGLDIETAQSMITEIFKLTESEVLWRRAI